MKKMLILIFSLALLAACSSKGSGGEASLSMDSFVDAFSAAGVEPEEDKPMYSLIGAKDGVILYNDGSAVKIYEFASEKDIKEAEKSIPAMKDWDKNGLFILETSHEDSKEIFNSVK